MFCPGQKKLSPGLSIRGTLGFFMPLRERERDGEREQERDREREREKEKERERERERQRRNVWTILFLSCPGQNETFAKYWKEWYGM
jgi:hypothetical protein